MIVIRKPRRVVGGPRKIDDFMRQELSRAAKEYAPSKHPLLELGDGQTPIGHARAVLEHLGRLSTYRGHVWLDGACATPLAIMLAANCVLKEHGLPQIGKRTEWLV